MENGNWVPCILDDDYEICDQYPHNIRRKGSSKNVVLSMKKKGYLQINLNRKPYAHHRVVALQFIENDDPETKTEVDHINHDRADNHISNLRWVSSAQNQKYRGGYAGKQFTYLDVIPEDSVEVTTYNNRELENYYYSPAANAFYLYDDIGRYRVLTTNVRNNQETVKMYDKNGNRFVLSIMKFKRLYI